LLRTQGEITASRSGIGDQEAHNSIVKHLKCSADIGLGTIGWRKYMRIFAITYLILSITTLSSCGYEVDEPPTIDGGTPPVIRYPIDTVGGPIYIYGPYTLEQLKQEHKIVAGETGLTESQKEELKKIYGDKNYLLWEVYPLGAYVPSITYGIVPETYKQVYPANGKPEDLKEGVIYEVITVQRQLPYPPATIRIPVPLNQIKPLSFVRFWKAITLTYF